MRLRKNILLLSLIVAIFSHSSFLYAQERFVLSFNVDYLDNIYKGQIEQAEKEKAIIAELNLLGVNIESKKDFESSRKLIDNISADVVELANTILKTVSDAIPIRRGLDELIDKNELKQNRPFGYFDTIDITEGIYDILNDAGVTKVSHKEIKKLYTKQTDDFDKRLSDIITTHTKLWIKGINAGKEYDKVMADYKLLITDILLFNSKIYADSLKSATKIEIAKVQELKTAKIKKMVLKRDARIDKNLAKLKKSK